MLDPSTAADWLRLALTPGIGPANFHVLIEAFQTPSKVLSQKESDLTQIPRLSRTVIRSLLETSEGKREGQVVQEIEFIQSHGITILTRDDAGFPPLLREIPTPPMLLFLRGEILPTDQNAVAIVGTRRCDSYGLRMTREIAGQLAAAGITIISGLARGIDSAAHSGALAVGGRTMAFLPCGFGSVYPPEHKDLLEEIVQHGAVLTEYPHSVQAIPRCFPPRNRLVSGSSLGVLVVQAPAKSGALITARLAMEQNREVFALPGRVNEETSEGPLRLIQDGAKLIRNAEDILVELQGRLVQRRIQTGGGPDIPKGSSPRAHRDSSSGMTPQVSISGHTDIPGKDKKVREKLEDPVDRRIVLRLEAGQVHIDRLAADLDLPVGKVSERLLLLEMRGMVRRLPGMSFDLA